MAHLLCNLCLGRTILAGAPMESSDRILSYNNNNRCSSRLPSFRSTCLSSCSDNHDVLHGIYGWHHVFFLRKRQPSRSHDANDDVKNIKATPNALAATPQSRILERLPRAETLCAGICIYQAWDFVASCLLAEHRHVVFLVHHVAAAWTAYGALEYQLLHHYAIFFGGCSEISSFFLVWMDLDRYFPMTENSPSWWATFIVSQQAGFVVTFVAYRIVGWIYYSTHLWNTVWEMLRQRSTPEKSCPTLLQLHRPGDLRSAILCAFLVMNVALGALQMYWLVTGLLPKIIEIVMGEKGIVGDEEL